MAVVGSLIVLLGANTAPLTAGLLKAEGELKGFGSSTTSMAATTGAIFGGIGLVAAAGMGLAVSAAMSFQEQMAKVNTIVHMGEPELAALGQQVRNLSVATGVGVGDLTSGLYDLFSVGVPAGQAMEILTNATTLSIGGLSTANEAVDAITTAINSWSTATGAATLTMADSTRVTDIFAQAIAAGGMTAADIPEALANVAAQAAMMNMPLEEVAATWSILTVRGLSASEASTALAATLTALAKAPPGMEKLEKATGKTYLQIAKTQGVHEAIMEIVADAQRLGVNLEDVFGRKEALPFVTFTSGAGGDQLWGQALAAEYNSAGVASGQMAERMGTLQRQMDIFGASVTNLGITLGTALLPSLTMIAQGINSSVGSVTAWATANPQLSSSLLPVIAGVGLLGAAIAIVGAPLVLIGVAVGLAITHMGELAAGIQVVIDKWNELASIPGIGLVAGIASGQSSNNAAVAGLGIGQTFRQGAMNNTPVPYAGRGGGFGSPGSNPIVLQHTTNVHLDGQKVGEIVERRLYNDASVYSSGFASDERPRQ